MLGKEPRACCHLPHWGIEEGWEVSDMLRTLELQALLTFFPPLSSLLFPLASWV